MLEIKKIKKSYKTGTFEQTALNEVSLSFRKSEFVAILGQSGSGKTTMLNIIGGLDKYDSGDLIINNKSTKKFKEKDWDAYRNNCIGFVFQSYNLITHISILANVEMSMTLSGVSSKNKKKRALEALEKVGIKEHAHKKPNQLSGGQMQRVAIARALVNNPDIILADEPTGALDSKTSVEVMELIKEIAKEKLVIMVTHNSDLAHEYTNRIVELKDGEIINDSNPIKKEKENNENFKIKKTSMNFFSALKLSFNNIRTKKGRTLLTAFASSIGIIGIALILSLSNGFDLQIAQFERDTLSSLPIMVTEQAMDMNEDTFAEIQDSQEINDKSYSDEKVVYSHDPIQEQVTHTNKIDETYVNYVNEMDSDLFSGISYSGATNFNVIVQNSEGEYNPLISGTYTSYFSYLPQKTTEEDKYEFMETNYDVLAGSLPTKKEELVIMVDDKNRIDKNLLKALGFDPEKEEFSFDEIVGKELKLINNNDYYTNMNNFFVPNMEYQEMYENGLTLEITGIVRGKESKEFVSAFSTGIGYTSELLDYIIDTNKESEIVKAQEDSDYNIMSGQKFETDEEKEMTLTYLGANQNPFIINIFSKDFETKEDVVAYLDEFNKDKADEDKIIYNDMGEMLSQMSGDIMDGITIVLIAFSAISLIVSSIMIGIITYISVLERTKEIGILRALGARKKDITRVFNAETFIIGLASGLIGITITRLMLIPANIILFELTTLENVAVLNPIHAIVLILISLILTLLGGFIPAKMASKKDPVEALRTE